MSFINSMSVVGGHVHPVEICQGSLGDTAQLFRMTAEAAGGRGDTFKESFYEKNTSGRLNSW